MMVDPNCDGSMDALNDIQSDNDAYIASIDEREFIRRQYWQARDLDRLQFDGTWGSSW